MRDEHYTPFKGSSDPPHLEVITVFVMARQRESTRPTRCADRLRCRPTTWSCAEAPELQLQVRYLDDNGSTGVALRRSRWSGRPLAAAG